MDTFLSLNNQNLFSIENIILFITSISLLIQIVKIIKRKNKNNPGENDKTVLKYNPNFNTVNEVKKFINEINHPIESNNSNSDINEAENVVSEQNQPIEVNTFVPNVDFNELNNNNNIEFPEKSQIENFNKSSESSESEPQKLCKYVLKRGTRMGQQCGKVCKGNPLYCDCCIRNRPVIQKRLQFDDV